MVQSPTPSAQTPSGETSANPTNLPESPPDSGSEPPYSPNVKSLHLNQPNINMNTLTELHVPHHHNLLTPATELYLANEHQHQQQQLLQINNLLHKNQHEAPLHHHQTPQDHMLLYQVNQSGQIIELNHIHQQSQPMGRMYKGLDVELEGAGPLPDIQCNMSDNLQMIGESFTPLGNQGSVKKRKGAAQAFIPDGDGNLKAFIKSESSE